MFEKMRIPDMLLDASACRCRRCVRSLAAVEDSHDPMLAVPSNLSEVVVDYVQRQCWCTRLYDGVVLEWKGGRIEGSLVILLVDHLAQHIEIGQRIDVAA